MMYRYGFPGSCGIDGGFGFGWIFMIIFWAVIIWAIIALVRHFAGRDSHWQFRGKDEEALRILRERYAKGEISKDEFEERKAALLGR